MCQFIEKYSLDIEQFDQITAIPLYATRLREREFNQSEILAKMIGEKFNIPYYKNILKRQHHTISQTTLSQKERWTNLSEAFRIKNSSIVSNKNILIVDDLLTTGATASEAARILKENGAATVGILTLAIVEET